MKSSRILHIRLVTVLALSGTLLPGCRRDEVRRYRIPKEAASVVAGIPSPESNPPESPTPESNPPESNPPGSPSGGLQWTLPQGWTLSEGDGMRYATLKPSTPGKIDVSVIALLGTAGGELANVNRWRDQMKLPPAQSEKDLAGMRKTTTSPAGDVAVFDFTSPGADKARTEKTRMEKTRMIVGVLGVADGNTWFLKMTGDEAPVAQAKKEFLQWIGSLRFE
jgi:hypothetical protein